MVSCYDRISANISDAALAATAKQQRLELAQYRTMLISEAAAVLEKIKGKSEMRRGILYSRVIRRYEMKTEEEMNTIVNPPLYDIECHLRLRRLLNVFPILAYAECEHDTWQPRIFRFAEVVSFHRFAFDEVLAYKAAVDANVTDDQKRRVVINLDLIGQLQYRWKNGRRNWWAIWPLANVEEAEAVFAYIAVLPSVYIRAKQILCRATDRVSRRERSGCPVTLVEEAWRLATRLTRVSRKSEKAFSVQSINVLAKRVRRRLSP